MNVPSQSSTANPTVAFEVNGKRFEGHAVVGGVVVGEYADDPSLPAELCASPRHGRYQSREVVIQLDSDPAADRLVLIVPADQYERLFGTVLIEAATPA